MSISIAKSCDLIEIMYLLKVCSNEMNSAGCFFNFFRPQISGLIDKGDLYAYRNNNESTVALLALNTNNIEEYKKIDWKFNSGKILFIRILIHPKWRKFGIGKEFLDIVEKYAFEHSFQSIRLDVFADNRIAVDVLTDAQYKKAGEINLPFQTTSFICFEKNLKI